MTNQYIGVAQSTFIYLGFGWWTPALLAFTIEKCSVFLATCMDYENYVYAEKGHFDFQGDQICDKKDVEIRGHPKCWVFDHESSPPAIYWNRTRDWQEHHRNHSVRNQEHLCSCLPSWELAYPLPRHFWSWFSFFKSGYVRSQEGYQLWIWAGKGYPLCKLQTAPEKLLEVITGW